MTILNNGPSLAALPDGVLHIVAANLDAKDLACCMAVDQTFRRIVSDPKHWQKFANARSPDGSKLMMAFKKKIVFKDTHTGVTVGSFPRLELPNDVVCSPDGDKLATFHASEVRISVANTGATIDSFPRSELPDDPKAARAAVLARF